jgi:hypothetical protein
MEGLRRKHAGSRSLVSGKTRSTLARNDIYGLREGPEVVRVSYPVDLRQDCGYSARE